MHGFHKPTKQQPMIFYCRAGIRGNTAMDLAKRAGYKLQVSLSCSPLSRSRVFWLTSHVVSRPDSCNSVRNYEGSYLDWEKREAGSNNQDD